MSVATVQFFSPSLNRHTNYNVIIPTSGEGPYHVLFQLHGLSDDYQCWVQRSNIVRHAAAYPLLVVMPDGGTDGYLNLTSGDRLHRYRWEDALIQDLAGHVRRTFNVTPEEWAIGGLSMGGYGSLRLGLKHHHLFRSIWAHSSATHIGEVLADVVEDRDDAEILTHARTVAALPTDRRPSLAFDCGVDDYLIDHNRRLHEDLTAMGVEHTYDEHPGAHTWNYWDEHVQTALARHAEVLGLAANP